ncbi:hypothetical protein PV327_008553 [Microctonus hyperodae]|uniref:C3H1-type domain-containing protein n=1 Tax=Microctonus hyperodae TaxID=165561 RepID=A0AA39F3E3_MICHY|nr:hypothetical protein PV327_008553 [Microctonus hyperodae]
MLPSTGYFKTIVCPFYENGSCDRPYCHFKHLRKEDVSNSTATTSLSTDSRISSNEKNQRGRATANIINTTKTSVTSHNPEMIQQLVSDAVNKVLADQSVTDKEKVSENIVSKVVEGLKPTLTPTIGRHIGVPQSISKPPCVYNPTPIAELKKRHIAVPVYNPTRESGVAVKRKTDDTVKPWLSCLPESIKTRPSEITYKPTAIINSIDKDAVLNYVPTAKSDCFPLNSYDDSNSSDYLSSKSRKEAYYPKAKKRREEYVPKMIKPPLQSVQQLDETILNEFQPEFNMLDDILIADTKKKTNHINNDSSRDLSDVEAKFSDDDDDEIMNEMDSTKEVQKMHSESDGNNSRRHLEEKENKTRDIKSYDSNNSSTNNKADTASSGDELKRINLESHKSNEKSKSSKSKSERSKREHKSSTSGSSSSKSRDRDKREHSRDKKDDGKHNSSSNDKRRSSTSSKHSGKSTSHRNKNKDSSSHSNKDKSRSSRDKNSSTNENNDKTHKSISSSSSSSSRHDKHASSKSKSDKKLSSKSTKSDSHSYSSHKTIKSREKTTTSKSESEHDDYSNGVLENNFFNEELLQSSDSDHDVEEECLKIFQEYQVSDHPKGVTTKHEPAKLDTEEIEGTGKKRVAHPSAANSVVRTLGPSNPPKRLQNPQQRMYERWRLMREAAAEKAVEKATALPKSHSITDKDSSINITPVITKELKTQENIKLTNDSQVNGNGRMRIAPVPYARSLEMTKKKVLENAAAAAAATTSTTKSHQELKTVAQTTKGGPRVAHIPQVVPQLSRPEPLHVTTQKFPINVRQYYVNLMHDICIQIYTSAEDAAQRALREEHMCHERCKALPVYKNSCMLAAHRLRKEVDQGNSGGGSNIVAPSGSGMISHDAILAGKTKGSWGVVKTKKAITNFKGPALYCMLKKWIMTEQQLRDNGFPRIHPDGPKGRAKVYVINTRNQSILSKVPNERYCSRCGQTYMVDKFGVAIQQRSCIYHWGRKFTIRGEGKYSCCQQYGSASGCCESKNHVWDYVDVENLRGYVQTLPKDIPATDQGVFALDCEMCYTTQGLELTRVTVINDDCKVVYETLVRPENEIIDYNTRFSGITEDHMTGVTTSILDVQATLLTMFSNETILVGHSLESDFKALKLIHNTVVDTSHVFPHKNGYPQKRALKNLCSEYLRKIIQNDVSGHDSNEDAVACMELIHWKVKEEAKLQ